MTTKLANYLHVAKLNCYNTSIRNQYDGVAYFFRALFYFQMVKRFGDVPWYNQVLKSDDDKLLFKPRDTRGLVMDSVMSDLDKAIQLLPTSHSISRVTKWTALALKTRAALFEGTFQKYHGMADHDKYLNEVVTSGYDFIENSGYSLYDQGTEPYRSLFNSDDANPTEVILAKIYTSNLNLMNSIQFNINNSKQGFTKRFVNHYLMADGSRFDEQPGWEKMQYPKEVQGRDPRLHQTILSPGYIQTGTSTPVRNKLLSSTGYKPIKFISRPAYDGANKGVTDWPIFRAAEVYLNFAEAKAELGTITQEDIDISINKIRDRANMPPLILSDANLHPDSLLLVSCQVNNVC